MITSVIALLAVLIVSLAVGYIYGYTDRANGR